ncbi:MAG: LLM class F420-dependent oxidoreductase [Candidatus Dadabacteria bacterium]|nr:MAG: LLM class F420-dependent oxidoreductase [Candidatus Dadabacteria bacterium]
MKFAAALAFADVDELCELARTAEASGWDYVGMSDHVVHPARIGSRYPYTDDGRPRWPPFTPWPDPWVAIGAMAAVTTRIRFVTNVYVLPMRNPFLVAKAVATASVISGGRVDMGVGVGWMREEFELLGQDFRNRGRRLEEMIEVLGKLWRGEMVEHHGRYYSFPPLEMTPAPVAPVPIYGGGMSEKALRRAARLFDGWISDLDSTEGLARSIARIERYRREYGRERLPFAVFASATDAFDVDGYRRLEEVGVTHLLTLPWALYGSSPRCGLAEKKAGLERFAEDVIARMN